MANAAKITNIDPAYGIAGGEIVIDCEGFDTSEPSRCTVTIGEAPAQIVALSPRRVLAIVPETKGGRVEVRLSSKGDLSEPGFVTVAKKLAGDLHPVA
ncbi:MAG TPA: IPT/TIG domain-containing protein, partial [Pyrinomonadaceae bacterium]|nr:IPT/TIG domain-containing protein [Pyrinomonadaceae bacterium]